MQRDVLIQIELHIADHSLAARKVDAVKEGFDPDLVTDPLYFLDPDSGTFVKLDTNAFTWICGPDSRI